jgi:glycosyltransferase involved in cell wall biosynthesis
VKFSVVIPVYNRAAEVARAIESVLAQTVGDFEVIVVDDGSTDDVERVISQFGDSRILFVRQVNCGASSARNRGIDTARGEYVAFLDSDDLYHPDHLARAGQALGKIPGTAFYSPVLARRAAGLSFVKPPRSIRAGEHMAEYLMCDRGFVQTSGLVVPRRFAQAVRYREDTIFGDDTDFAVRLQLAGCAFTMGDVPSVTWRDDNSMARLSMLGTSVKALGWLEDLKERIPPAAYHGYRGWHLAKSVSRSRPLLAARLYARAVFEGSYSFGVAALVLCQIILPEPVYRSLANSMIRLGGVTRGLRQQ